MARIASSLLLVLLPLLVAAQYEQDWVVEQDFYEYGYLHYDFTGDGSEELIKPYGNAIYVFDGTAEYELVWTISSTQYESLTIWDDAAVDATTDIVLVLAANSTDTLTFQLRAYEPLADLPLWSTSEQPGTLSYADVANLDADPPLEVVLGGNEYRQDTDDYVSRFLVLDGASGAVEFESAELNGYMVGPYAGDADGNGEGDILINLYDLNEETATLHAFSSSGLAVPQAVGNLTPLEIDLGTNYPNPFNPATTIPLTLQRPADVEIHVTNVQGQRIATLLTGRLYAGRHEFRWDGRSAGGGRVASGIYFAEVITDGHRIQRPMVLLK